MFVEFHDLFLGMTAGEHYTKNTLFELLKTIGHPDIEALDADTVFNVMKLSKSIRVFKPTGGRYRTVYVAVKLPVDPTVTGMTGITGSGEACPSSLLEGTDATGTTSPDEANPSTPPRGPTVRRMSDSSSFKVSSVVPGGSLETLMHSGPGLISSILALSTSRTCCTGRATGMRAPPRPRPDA